MAEKFAVHRIRGQMVKVKKANKETSTFKSRTGRQIETEVKRATKEAYPSMA